jgi:hypothetical protein
LLLSYHVSCSHISIILMYIVRISDSYIVQYDIEKYCYLIKDIFLCELNRDHFLNWRFCSRTSATSRDNFIFKQLNMCIALSLFEQWRKTESIDIVERYTYTYVYLWFACYHIHLTNLEGLSNHILLSVSNLHRQFLNYFILSSMNLRVLIIASFIISLIRIRREYISI